MAIQALALSKLGNTAEAMRAIGEATRLGEGLGHFHHSEHAIANAYAVMGRKPEAVAWLRRSAENGFPCYPFFAGDPHLAGLRGDPAFEALMSELRSQWERRRTSFPAAR